MCWIAHVIYFVVIVGLIFRLEWRRAERKILLGQLERAHGMLELARQELEESYDEQ